VKTYRLRFFVVESDLTDPLLGLVFVDLLFLDYLDNLGLLRNKRNAQGDRVPVVDCRE
jgi:hypothetical protein